VLSPKRLRASNAISKGTDSPKQSGKGEPAIQPIGRVSFERPYERRASAKIKIDRDERHLK
jgi:hypothetical protein